MLHLAVVVPTYNEVNNVEALITAIGEVAKLHHDTQVSLVILDDSSPDGTADLVRELAPRFATQTFSIRVIVKPTKEGLGAAYIFGFTALLAEGGYDYFLQMDADLSHDPKYISGFIHQAKAGTEFVVASRYIPGGGTPDWTFDRKFLSRGGNIYARMLLSPRITDYTGGFNMYSARLLAEIAPTTINASGYGFLLALKYRALRKARSFVELPIVFLDRTHGVSKIPSGTLAKSFFLVPRIRFGREN
ncbi:polyprenol monophosphomannose synthase [Microbacteriaceae bacterium VKM Ac-2855]|nr:polyprenol monophosphomannose synthase [Microbacteriaceae bacterium VKM Ac-2855]